MAALDVDVRPAVYWLPQPRQCRAVDAEQVAVCVSAVSCQLVCCPQQVHCDLLDL